METKKMIKKIASIGAVATVMGATLMGAALAADLNEYPNMFLEDGQFNGLLVVGADAKAEDVIGVTNIATSLQSVAVKTTAVETESEGVLDVSEGYQLCNKNLYPGVAIADCEPSVDDSDLDILADGVYHDSEGVNDNDEKYTQQLFFEDSDTGLFLFTQDDDEAPNAGTYLQLENTNDYFYGYELQFDSAVEVDEDEPGDDLEGTSIEIQGMEYTITNVETDSSGVTGLELQYGSGATWLSEGESITKVVDGVEHTIEMTDVTADASGDDGACGIKVDGSSLWVDVHDTETVNGVTIGVTDAKRVNIQAETSDVCKIVVGGGELTLSDGDEIEMNGEDVDGTEVTFTNSAPSGDDLRWTGFTIDFAPDSDEVYLSPGDEYVDPIFGNFKLVFAGVETDDLETIKFDASSKSAEWTFSNEDGTEVELPLAADGSYEGGEATDEPVFWGNEAPSSSATNEDELLYLSGETCTGSSSVVDCQGAMFLVVEPTKDEAHVIQITNIDTSDNEISFDDLTYDTSDDDVEYDDESSTSMDLKSAGTVSLLINETASTITFDDIGSWDGTEIKTENRGTLTIVNSDLDSQEYEGLSFSEFDDGDLDSGEYVEDLTVTAVYDDDDDNQIEIESSSVSGLTSTYGQGFFDESDDNDNTQVFYTNKGTLISYDQEDKGMLSIEHPYDTVYASVYVTPTDAVASSSSSVTSEVVPISVSAVKLDNEVSNPTSKNIIAVGGPCANSVVAELMGNPSDCSTALGLESGQALIKLYENGDYVAFVVAGQTAEDTRLAAQIVSSWEDYDLNGNEMLATTVSETSLSIESVN